MKWVKNFYSKTGTWWGPAESKISERDYKRAETIARLVPNAKRIFELGSGYGNTAAACAQKGYEVTAIEISDRVDFSKQYIDSSKSNTLKFIKGSFYDVNLDETFDAVCYWNGLGIGTDSDQRQLLKRVAGWLKPNGAALIDVQNPFVWYEWSKEGVINKKARPEAGYNFNVSEQISFDPSTNRLIDAWWETEKPQEKISQDLRCYSPPDLELLLEGTGLKIDLIDNYNKDNSEYLVKLVLDK